MSESEFAKRQLKKHGWTEGSGLGKQENGRCEPIKVSLKMDKTGVGHDPGKEFTDHWWLRVFNEAAQKIGKMPQSENELKQKKNDESKNNLYKNFVKSSTLTNGIEKTSHSDSSSEDSSDNENDTRVPTLNDIHKFCGGATGHKAARFGIKMGGKLARVAEHEKMFEERLEREKLDLSATNNSTDNSLPDTVDQKSSLLNGDSLSDKQIPCDVGDKRKKKRKKDKYTQDVCDGSLDEELTEIPCEIVSDRKLNKKRKKHKDKCSQDVDGGSVNKEITQIPCDIVDDKSKKKQRKHKKDKYSQDADDKELTNNPNGRLDDMMTETVSKKHKKSKYNVDHVDSQSELSKSNETQHPTKSKEKHKSVDNESAVLENHLPEINESHKNKIVKNVSNRREEKESRGNSEKRKTEQKARICDDLLNESEREKKTEGNISSLELVDGPRRKKKKKDGQNILLDESESKRKNKKNDDKNKVT